MGSNLIVFNQKQISQISKRFMRSGSQKNKQLSHSTRALLHNNKNISASPVLREVQW